MHRFTDLSNDELKGYLDKIRRIANMDNDDALQEVDELVNHLELRGGSILNNRLDADGHISKCNNDIEEAKQELQEFREELENYRKSGRVGEFEDENLGGDGIREIAAIVEMTALVWPESVKEELREEIAEIKREANQLADELDISYYSAVVLASKTGEIYNINSVRGILKTLSRAEAELQKRAALNDDLCQEIRRERERCAWFRAKKRMLEMRVAEKSGNKIKAARSKSEAQALLEQDWQEVFPDEHCPGIDL